MTIASGFEAEIPLADNLQVYAPTCHPAADTTSHGAEGLTYQRMCSLATILLLRVQVQSSRRVHIHVRLHLKQGTREGSLTDGVYGVGRSVTTKSIESGSGYHDHCYLPMVAVAEQTQFSASRYSDTRTSSPIHVRLRCPDSEGRDHQVHSL